MSRFSRRIRKMNQRKLYEKERVVLVDEFPEKEGDAQPEDGEDVIYVRRRDGAISLRGAAAQQFIFGRRGV